MDRTVAASNSRMAEEFMVSMRDGVRLATDVYLPRDVTATEAVVVRLPYDKNSRYVFFEPVAHRFTERGYAVIVQDVRGKFRSEGETLAFLHEAADGYDTIEWVTRQSWSNGVVGMFGDSYYGFTQWAAVSSGHPALRAIVPRVTSADLAGTWRPSGPVREAEWLTTADYLVRNWTDRYRYEVDFDWSVRPLRDAVEAALEAIGARSVLLDLVMADRDAEDDEAGDAGAGLMPLIFPDGHPFECRPLPVLHCVGWYDNLLIPSIRDYVTLVQRAEWAELQYLWADSIDHENYHLSDMPITEGNDHALRDDSLQQMLDIYAAPALDFFDVFLKGVRPVASLPRVQWHLGHDSYRQSPSWPPPGASEIRLYLAPPHGGGLAEGSLGLVTSDEAEVSWIHDPDDLVPSAVTNSFSFLHDYPDERAAAIRSDVLTFATEPAQQALDLAGPIRLHVALTSTGPSTDLFSKLLDVAPDGESHMIARGQGEIPSAAYEQLLEIDLGHVGYRLRPGHRLRLQLASSDFPEFVPHPGTSENRWSAVGVAPTTQKLTWSTSDANPYVSLTTLSSDQQ